MVVSFSCVQTNNQRKHKIVLSGRASFGYSTLASEEKASEK